MFKTKKLVAMLLSNSLLSDKMKTLFLMLSIFALSLSAESFKDFKQQQYDALKSEKKAFKTYKENTQAEFSNYVKEINAAYNKYKKELSQYWKDPKLSSQKKWVNYTKDKQTRTTVGFDTNTIVIETIATTPKEAELKLKLALATVAVDDTKSAIAHDELQQKIKRIERQNKKLIVNMPLKNEQILAPIIFKKPPSAQKIITYVNKKVQPKDIVLKPSKIHDADIYTLKVKLPSDTMIKRSRSYEKTVRKNAKRFDLPLPLVFAVIHTESAYNPFAKSHIPAYGLMQIVPRSAGIDSYLFLHNKKKMPSATYLYDSSNNIEMGSAYLHILYYRYLKAINHPTSRLYCTIAAYNTGAGNVAYAFTRNHNIKLASKKINRMQPKDVYSHLSKYLKYEEAQNYLDRVSGRFNAYKKVYRQDNLVYLNSEKIVY